MGRGALAMPPPPFNRPALLLKGPFQLVNVPAAPDMQATGYIYRVALLGKDCSPSPTLV